MFATIFVGGGTPSVLNADQLVGILRLFRSTFAFIEDDVETSIEINPATVDYDDLARLHDAGFNRVSIGVQSLDDRELDALGRPHTGVDAIRIVRDAKRAGFYNCNVDLMYGLPGQTTNSWRETLSRALDENPDHLAIYELTIEEGTPFALLNHEGKLDLPSEETVLEMMSVTGQMVTQAGYTKYEISNYAKPGYECRHNINYWQNGSYLGLGPGAVSCISGRRVTAIKNVAEFFRTVDAANEWWSETEKLAPEERFRETMIMGLRMVRGLSIRELEARFKINPLTYYGQILDDLVGEGLVQIRNDHIMLSSTGMMLANQVMARLV